MITAYSNIFKWPSNNTSILLVVSYPVKIAGTSALSALIFSMWIFLIRRPSSDFLPLCLYMAHYNDFSYLNNIKRQIIIIHRNISNNYIRKIVPSHDSSEIPETEPG